LFRVQERFFVVGDLITLSNDACGIRELYERSASRLVG